MRWALPALILVLSVAVYVLRIETVRHDRDHAAAEGVAVESVRTEAVLERARAYLVSLGGALDGEPAPSARRFAQLQGSAAGTVGLTGALWVERVAAAGLAAYELRTGVPITRLTRTGAQRPSPPAPS